MSFKGGRRIALMTLPERGFPDLASTVESTIFLSGIAETGAGGGWVGEGLIIRSLFSTFSDLSGGSWWVIGLSKNGLRCMRECIYLERDALWVVMWCRSRAIMNFHNLGRERFPVLFMNFHNRVTTKLLSLCISHNTWKESGFSF